MGVSRWLCCGGSALGGNDEGPVRPTPSPPIGRASQKLCRCARLVRPDVRIFRTPESARQASEHELGALEVLRCMRNACAHSRQEINFDTPELQDAAKLLLEDYFALDSGTMLVTPAEVYRAVFMLRAGSMLETKPRKNRHRFKRAVQLIGLLQAAPQASPKRRKPLPSKRGSQSPKGSKPQSPPRSSQA
jgi:hypothetical protein